MTVQLSTVLSCIWLCGLAGSKFRPGFGPVQRVGYGQGLGQVQGYNLGQGIGYGRGYLHQNLLGYGYNQLQGQPYAHAQLQKQPYGTLPGQISLYLKFQGYPKRPIDGGFKRQIAELPPKQGHTQQQQREAWQIQIDQVVKVEEKLKQRSLFASRKIGRDKGSKGAKPAVGKILDTFEIVDLHSLKKVESIEKSDGLKENLEVMNNKQSESVQEEIQEVKSVLQPDSLYQISSYIEEAERFLRKFNEKQKLKDNVPAYPESLKENNVADKSTENDNNSVENAQSTTSDVVEKVPEEKLEQSQIKDILIENVQTKEGLKEIIKKLLKTKLESQGLLGI